MRTDITIGIGFDSGAVLRLTMTAETDLDRDDRVVLANLLQALEGRLVCPTPAERAEEDARRLDLEVETEIEHLRMENGELRRLVAQIPPGSMVGVPSAAPAPPPGAHGIGG